MVQEGLSERFKAKLEGVGESFAEWRAAHPRATLTEIEDALSRSLEPARAELLAEAAMASTAADFARSPRSTRARCPQCGGRLRSEGKHQRTLLNERGAMVCLERSYARCEECGTEFFPPR